MDERQKKLLEELLAEGKPRPSFVKGLFFGVVELPPFPKETSDPQLIEQFQKLDIDPDLIDRQAFIPSHVIRQLGAIGAMGVTIPKEYGGLGLSQYAYCRFMEEVAKKCSSIALFLNAHQSIGLKAIQLFGTEEQKREWLPSLARGEKLAAFALTEKNAGSDAGAIETTAVLENGEYVLNGRKQWITNGANADVLTVMAKLDGKVTAFLVTPSMPGFIVETAALEKVGMRGTATSVLRFENLKVPQENILGEKGKGLKIALTVLDYGRTTFGATCTGLAKACMEKAFAHAKSRKQFGRPLASFDLIKQKLGKIAALTYAMESTTYLTAGILDSGEHDIMLEAAILKVFASDASWEVLFETMQIFGGKAFFTDEPLERWMRDARLNTIGEGANEVLKVFVGAVGMREVGVQAIDAKKFLKLAYYRLFTPKTPDPRLGKAVKRFGKQVFSWLKTYREDIVEKQLVLEKAAKGAEALYTMAAVMSRGGCEAYVDFALEQFDEAMGPVNDRFVKLADEKLVM